MAMTADEIRLLLVGKTGKGKSTTGNNILGKELFNSSPSASSVTKDCELKRNMRNGTMIEIMDSPGLFDTRKSKAEVLFHILKAVACMNPGPDAVLFILSIERFTDEEYQAYTDLKTAFETNITKYIILIFTNAERLKKMTIEQWLETTAPENLKKVCAEVENRCLAINNFAEEPEMENKIDTLLQKVRNLIHVNGSVPYSCPKYAKVGEIFEQELKKRLEKEEEKAIQKSNAYKNQLAKDNKLLQQLKEKIEKERQDFEREREREKQFLEEQKEQLLQKAEFEKEKQRKDLELKEKERRQREDEEKRRKECLEREEMRLKEMEEKVNKEKEMYFKEMEERRQEMIRRMKDEIAENKNPSFWSMLKDYFFEGISYILDKLTN